MYYWNLHGRPPIGWSAFWIHFSAFSPFYSLFKPEMSTDTLQQCGCTRTTDSYGRKNQTSYHRLRRPGKRAVFKRLIASGGLLLLLLLFSSFVRDIFSFAPSVRPPVVQSPSAVIAGFKRTYTVHRKSYAVKSMEAKKEKQKSNNNRNIFQPCYTQRRGYKFSMEGVQIF